MTLSQPLEPADETPLAPGMLESHYAPRTRLRLNATSVQPGELLLAFGPPLPGAAATLNLSEQGDVAEAAANLFGHLRRLDAMFAHRASPLCRFRLTVWAKPSTTGCAAPPRPRTSNSSS